MKTLLISMFCLALTLWTVSQAAESDEPQCDHIGYSPFTIRQEVCGSDGQTYSNEKHLEFENCLYRRAVKKVKNGWCKEEDQTRAEAERTKLAEQQAKTFHQQSHGGRRA